MATYYPAGGGTYNLGSSIGSTDTSILLSSFLEPVSNVPYTMVLLNTDIAFGTIAPGTTSSEFISFTGITQNANGTALLTGVTRGLAKKYPFTTSSTFKLPHSGQSIFILSDAPQVFTQYASKVNDEVITGNWDFTGQLTFTNAPITPLNTPATTSVLGVVKVSVAPASAPSPIAVGTNDPRVPVAYAVDSVGTDAYAITPSPAITAYVAGQQFTFKAGTANTGSATLNVSALGAKTIKKNVSTDLATGDILVNQIVTVVYDGTNMQVISFLPSLSVPNFGDGSDGDATISSPTTLTRDMYYNNLTVNSTLNTAGYRIFVNGTLAGNGTIANNGNNGTNAGAGTAGTGGATNGGYFPNQAGTNGTSSNNNAPTAPTALTNALNTTTGTNSGSGGGNNSGGGNGQAGATGNAPTGVNTKVGINKFQSISGLDIGTTSTIKYTAGQAGAGGAGGTASTTVKNGGGGGGAAGGIVLIIARNWTGSFTITANGGNGGNGFNDNSGTSNGGGGGGGAGQGGTTFVIYLTKTWTGSYSITGGTGGTGAAGSGTNPNNGGNGGNGASGNSYELLISSLI